MLDDAAFMGFIPVTDLDGARRFYCETLGLRLIEHTPFAVVVDGPGVTLRLTQVAELSPQPFTVAGWLVRDIAAAVTGLIGAGVEMKRYDGMAQDQLGVWTTPGGDQVAWFADPDGNVLSLTTLAADG